MDHQRQSNGVLTFLEHFGFLFIVIVALVASQAFDFFMGLSDTHKISCYGISLALGAVGLTLVFFAKLPLYRERRFFTFGNKALPQGSRVFYSRGHCCITVAVALLLCLLLSAA